MTCADGRRCVRIRSEEARRARHAVLRRLEVADEVVVFERRGKKEQRVDREPDEVQDSRAALATFIHSRSVDDTAECAPRPAQRPTTTLRRAAQPPGGFALVALEPVPEASCSDTPAVPRMPGTCVYCASTATPTQRNARSSTPPSKMPPFLVTSRFSEAAAKSDSSV